MTDQAVASRGEVGRVRLRTLVNIRWLAILGQTIATLLVRYGLGFELPLSLVLSPIALSAWLNVVLLIKYPSTQRLSERQASLHLGYDLLQLSGLLFLTGGLENPFVVLMVVPITISASILSGRSTMGLGLIALLCVTLLSQFHLPLPWHERFVLPNLYLTGIWTALVLGTGFMSVYVWRVANETRRMTNAFLASEMALAREQQMSALGAMAAAAAHELGTPLGTIALVAKELRREIGHGNALESDVELLVEQADRCRNILASLVSRPNADDDRFSQSLPVTVFLRSVLDQFHSEALEIRLSLPPEGAQARQNEPHIRPLPEIRHGLTNLVTNALEFANVEVVVAVAWDQRQIRIDVRDDGCGFHEAIFDFLGEPYVTSSAGRSAHAPLEGRRDGMGLGIFIAKTLMERTGAKLKFRNDPSGGARVTIIWARRDLETISESDWYPQADGMEGRGHERSTSKAHE